MTVRRHPAAAALVVRRLTPADIPAVRRIFRETLALGRPLPFPTQGLAAYERLCLGWFLGPGWLDAGVLDDGAGIRGYVLVCTDLAAYRRWAARTAAAWALATAARLAAGRLRSDAARFHRLRLLDGLDTLRNGPPAAMPALVHLNLDRELRGRAGGAPPGKARRRALSGGGPAGLVRRDQRPLGARAAALHRAGFQVVHRARNHTLSWLAGRPVERLTVVRPVPAPALVAAATPPPPARPAARAAG